MKPQNLESSKLTGLGSRSILSNRSSMIDFDAFVERNTSKEDLLEENLGVAIISESNEKGGRN